MEPVSFNITQEMHLAFLRLQFDSSLKRGVLILSGLALVLAALLALLDSYSAALGGLIGGVIGITGVILIARFIILPRSSAKTWRDYALLKEPLEWAMDEQGFSITQPSAHVDAKWHDMVLWNESADLLAIHLNTQLAYILPKSAVSSAHVDFARTQLVASGLVQKGKRRK